MFAQASEEEKCLGSLPLSWVKKFAPDEIKAKTKEVFNLFSEFSASVYDMQAKNDELEERRMRELEFEIASLQGIYFSSGNYIQKKWDECAKCIKEIIDASENGLYEDVCKDLSSKLSVLLNEECVVKYLDAGAYGVAFQVLTKNDNLVLKTYNPIETEPIYHGGIVEPANAIYLNKAMKPERCAKFYCAKIESHKKGGGFMLTKYIEPENLYDDNKMKQINAYILNSGLSANKFHFSDIKSSDPYEGNFINGTLVDFGGIAFTYKSKKEYMIMKALGLAIKSGNFDKIYEIEKQYGECEEFQRCKKRLEEYFASTIAYK